MGMRGAALETGKAFDWDVTKRLFGYLKHYRRNIIIAMVAMIGSVVANVAGPPLIGYAIDEGIQTGDMTIAIGAAFGYLFIQILGFIGFRMQLVYMATAG
ncbi:MAG: hypothetical protein ACLFTK_14590, partial [Anaerolineales bacterium]